MDFSKVLPLILKEFEKENVRYAFIGGFAMGALGIMRATMDLDILIDSQDIPKIEKIMKKYNYNCVYKSENVSQYVSDIAIFGEIDFIHAFRKISLTMLKRAKELPIFEGKFEINVLKPEDVIGLKLQALVNEPLRENQEYADVESIMNCFKEKLDWRLLKEYFSLFEKNEKYKELKERYGNPKER